MTESGSAKEDYLEVIKELIRAGCVVDARDKRGRTPLDLAVARSDLQLMRVLLEAGADLNGSSGSCGRYERETCLHLAASTSTLEAIQYLLQAGADVNLQDRRGESSAIRAVKADRPEVLEVLKSHGADMHARDLEGWGGLSWAAWYGHEDVTTWLLREGREDPDRKDRLGKTALHIAAERGQERVVVLLLKHGADPGIVDLAGRTPHDYTQPQLNSIRDTLLTYSSIQL